MGSCCSSASRGQGEASPLPTLTGSNTGSSCDSLAATGAAGRVDHCEQQGSGVTAPSEVEGGSTPACVPTLRSGLVESVEATPPAATAVPIEQIEFYFLDAKKLLELDRLPTLTDGRKIEGLVKKEPINLNGIIRGEYTSKYLRRSIPCHLTSVGAATGTRSILPAAQHAYQLPTERRARQARHQSMV